jgi:hypothetical protein
MDCPECGTEAVVFAVDPDLQEYLPGEEPGAALCPRCLTVRPATDPPVGDPDLSQLGDAFPSNVEAGTPMALLLGLLSSLALYREEIAALLERVERAGTDPLLVIDRLADDPSIDSDVDLGRRRHQLEQLL